MQIQSDLPLASLAPSAGAHVAEGALELTISREPIAEPERWLYHDHFEDMSEPWRGVGVARGGYVIRLYRFADFFLPREGGEACVHIAAGAPAAVVETLFLEQVLPLWWSLLGRACLHASAVVWDDEGSAVRGAAQGRLRGGEHPERERQRGATESREGSPTLRDDEARRAIAFAGRSGSGKSTLATSLASEAGGALITDDCLAIDVEEERVIVHPGPRGVRLREDSAEAFFEGEAPGVLSIDGGKRRVALRAAESAVPLARVYMLEAGDVPRVTVLRGRDAVARLATHFFRIDPEDRSRLAAELEVLERIAARTLIARLAVPRRFEALAEVRAVIAEDLAK